MTNLDRETQKIRQRLAKPLVARLKYKWSKKKKKKKTSELPGESELVLSEARSAGEIPLISVAAFAYAR
jgi:hypothetical protein